jgi:hypothetical protein
LFTALHILAEPFPKSALLLGALAFVSFGVSVSLITVSALIKKMELFGTIVEHETKS